MKLIRKGLQKQMVGFALTGLLSTLIMFGLYISLYKIMNYQIAYLIAYSISVIALYFMNILLVFKKHSSLHTILEFPLIYLLQYFVSAASLEIIVWLGFSETFAPLLVLIALFPAIFLLNRMVFSKR